MNKQNKIRNEIYCGINLEKYMTTMRLTNTENAKQHIRAMHEAHKTSGKLETLEEIHGFIKTSMDLLSEGKVIQADRHLAGILKYITGFRKD